MSNPRGPRSTRRGHDVPPRGPRLSKGHVPPRLVPDNSSGKDWTKKCSVCAATPIVVETGMCGPCTFGEAETAGGNW